MMEEYIEMVMMDLEAPEFDDLTDEEKAEIVTEMVKVELEYQELTGAGFDQGYAEEVVMEMILGASMDAAMDRVCERRAK